jgi:hypothetical protein
MAIRRLRLPGCIPLLAVICGLMATPAPAQDDDPVLAAAEAAFEAAATDEARLAVVQKFLQQHPDHPQIGMVVRVGADLLSGAMNDPDAAVDLVETQLAKIGNAESKRQIQEILLDLYGRPGHADKLPALVADMYDPQAMTYVDHLTVIRAAAEAGAWPLVDAHCEAAAPAATSEAFRADYPDREYSAEEIEAAGRNRQGLLRTFAGWSAANRGDPAGAEAEFRAARELVRKNYFGLPDNELYRYWGRALVAQGKHDEGLEMLALAAIYGADYAADEAAREAFAALGRRPEAYDDYLWQVRLDHAPRIDDFTAVDYDGESRSFAGLRGKKATLLAFWFPT